MSNVNTKLLAACECAQRACGQATDTDGLREILDEAIASARQQMADDSTPVDEAWVEAIGFVGRRNTELHWPSLLLSIAVSDLPLRGPKTRGDVRRLLAALIDPEGESE